MSHKDFNTTWDGQLVSPHPPHGVSIIVYRRKEKAYEFLILHRAHQGPGYEGDWAWTPPSGARLPGEGVAQCAIRELAEEAGLHLSLQACTLGAETWAIFLAEAEISEAVTLVDEEHDRYEWVSLSEAINRCQPQQVSAAFVKVAQQLGLAGGEDLIH